MAEPERKPWPLWTVHLGAPLKLLAVYFIFWGGQYVLGGVLLIIGMAVTWTMVALRSSREGPR
jgi:hypothetical protein